jgi:hypothetical protein
MQPGRLGTGAHSSTQWAPSAARSEDQRTPMSSGFPDGETRTRTGDTTIFSRYVLAASGREIPGKQAVLGSRRRGAKRRSSQFAGFPTRLRRWRALISFSSGASADPFDDVVVCRLAGGHTFDEAGVCLDVGRSPLKAVGVEELGREQECGTLVGVGQRVVSWRGAGAAPRLARQVWGRRQCRRMTRRARAAQTLRA